MPGVLVRRPLLGLLLAALVGCETPSSTLDGGDLLGVFDHADAGRDAAADARPDGSAEAPEPPPPPLSRTPPKGSCVGVVGEPNRALRRTLGRPACRESEVREWRDAEGSPRYACVSLPKGAATRAPLPVVIFFHGEEDDAASALKKTSLRKHVGSFDLTGDVAHQGFILLAPQGRALAGEVRGAVFETDYLGPDNVDVATVDHFLAELVAQKLVDTRRVYTLGDSTGGDMAATYAMLRADKVAAFATFAADAPAAAWSCQEPPPPAVVAYRACDAVTPCSSVEAWLLARDKTGAETAYFRLGAGDEEETNCTPKNRCLADRGRVFHRRWPKGREDDILQALARHVLAAPR